MNQPSNEPRWTDDEMVDALTAQFLITRKESNADRWAKSTHEDVREWAAACIALQSIGRRPGPEQLAMRLEFAGLVSRVLKDVERRPSAKTTAFVYGDANAWLRRQLAWLEDLPS